MLFFYKILREAKETNETEKSHDAGAQGKQSHVTESLTTLFEHHQGFCPKLTAKFL